MRRRFGVIERGKQARRRLRDLVGVQPREFVTQVKLDRARELLETSERGMAEISPEVSFGDESTFRRAVRKRLDTRRGNTALSSG